MKQNILDILNFDDGCCSIFIIGGVNTGKSYLAKHIIKCLYDNKKIDYGMIFSKSIHRNQYNYFPHTYVKDDLENIPLYVNNVLNKQKEFIKKGIKKKCLLLFDDVMSIDFHHKFKNFYSDLVSLHRQFYVTVIFICHYIKKIPPAMRILLKNIFVFKSDDGNTIKELKNMCFPFQKDNDIVILLNKLNQFECLHIDKIKKIFDEKKYIIFKAPEIIDDFHIHFL